ncbi:2,3-bisphosphoglycerate-independent phosphoglycerate mutase [Phascolomyces articulosus]|uniref:2,3-bisphosphoglycerate-independent phosphoglycerate mutase n=1 Tax=Phascolomyces articulosus TaxID=60185 RepID=A0AAD5K8V4_9FUNG|nr:2,3-bisphosphoglycerate-independent phosphoglycerate mutase [Phascolomyces articulosus]
MPGGGEMPKEKQAPKENVCLICIDGWGVSPKEDPKGDAIRNADTPVMDELEKDDLYTTISAHGLSVGLPDKLMGNSEVGHLNIGAGRVVYQDIVRIDLAVKNKEFGKIPNIKNAFEHAKANNNRIHFIGLVSDGGVHSHIDHLICLLEAAKDAGVKDAFVQFIGDGRDTAPRSITKYVKQLQGAIDKLSYGKIATIVGRYYAMDRDKRWERVQVAFEGLTEGKGEKSDDPIKTIEERYSKDETDEFLKPIILSEEGRVKDGDTLFFFNFRSDRMREFNQAFGISPCPFDATVPKDLAIYNMTQYKSDFPFKVAFEPQQMNNVLAEWLSKNGIAQIHVAETEKYAHVTFFFNGGTEAQFDKEDRALIPSPKVATYDLQPEMSSHAVAERVAEAIQTDKYPFVMCNFAPPDMVGHTGKYNAAVKAVAATDKGIGIIRDACKKHGYILMITADHGNAEKMLSDDGKNPHTAHTTADVPFIVTSNKYKFIENTKGCLADVAPTILHVMGIDVPKEMTGHNLVQ